MSKNFPSDYFKKMDVLPTFGGDPVFSEVVDRLRGIWSWNVKEEEKTETRAFIRKAVEQGAFNGSTITELYTNVVTKLFGLVNDPNYNQFIRDQYTEEKHIEYLGHVLADGTGAALAAGRIDGIRFTTADYWAALGLVFDDTDYGFLNTTAIGTPPLYYKTSYDFLLEILGGKDAFDIDTKGLEDSTKVKKAIKDNLKKEADKSKSLSDYTKGATEEELKLLFKDLDQILLINNLVMMSDIRAFIRHMGILGTSTTPSVSCL